MKINWKVRIKNKLFWIGLIPLALLLVQQVLGVFGVTLDMSALAEQLLAIVNTVFAILGLAGVVVDHTTAGIGDSALALTYDEPKTDTKGVE